jgi:hypothetical protein
MNTYKNTKNHQNVGTEARSTSLGIPLILAKLTSYWTPWRPPAADPVLRVYGSLAPWRWAEASGRKLVTIIDPHIKKDTGCAH